MDANESTPGLGDGAGTIGVAPPLGEPEANLVSISVHASAAESGTVGGNASSAPTVTDALKGEGGNKSSSSSITPARALSALACPAALVSTNVSSSVAPNAADNDAAKR